MEACLCLSRRGASIGIGEKLDVVCVPLEVDVEVDGKFRFGCGKKGDGIVPGPEDAKGRLRVGEYMFEDRGRSPGRLIWLV